MRSKLLLISIIFFTGIFSNCKAQLTFHKFFYNSGQFNYIAFATAVNGDAVLASHYNNGPGISLAVSRIDSSGNMLWTKSYLPTASSHIPVTMAATPDNGVIIASVDTLQLNTYLLMKINTNGDAVWTRLIPAIYYAPIPPPLYVLPDGSFYFAHMNLVSLVLQKISADGNLLLQKNYDKLSTSLILPSAIERHENALYIGGYDNDSYSSFLVKTDTLGSIQWQKYNIGATSAILNLKTTSSGNVLLNTVSNATDTKVALVNSQGNVIWTKSIPLPQPRMIKISAANFALVSNNQGSMQAAIMDTLGNVLNSRKYHDSLSPYLFGADAMQGKGFYVSSTGSKGIWLMKANNNGDAACLAQVITITPGSYSLSPGNLTLTASNSTNTFTPVTYTSQSIALSDSDICNTIFPVKLLSFEGYKNQNKNILKWYVEEGINFSHFEIEKSSDGKNFMVLGKITFRNGGQYSFIDVSNSGLQVYYRLKMVDRDGKYSYSAVVLIMSEVVVPFTIFPNPFSDKLFINVPNGNKSMSMSIMDASGRIVLTSDNNYQAYINTSFLKSGVYFLRVKDAKGNEWQHKIIKQ